MRDAQRSTQPDSALQHRKNGQKSVTDIALRQKSKKANRSA